MGILSFFAGFCIGLAPYLLFFYLTGNHIVSLMFAIGIGGLILIMISFAKKEVKDFKNEEESLYLPKGKDINEIF